MPGTLYVVATPIGNLEDITLRSLQILREEVAAIACEDTRHTRKLLEHYEIRKPLISYHEHNEAVRSEQILGNLGRGDSIALVTDAGTPLVSDPGYRLVKAAIEAGFDVVPVPGASAVLAALAGSGLPVEEFRFIGFLPSKAAARRTTLGKVLNERATVVAYESPHRLLITLSEMAALFGERPIVVARELTKMHEEFVRGSAATVLAEFEARGPVKGEITLVIGRSEEIARPVTDPVSEILRLESVEGMNRMEAIKAVAKKLGMPKREIYRTLCGGGQQSPAQKS